MIFKKHINFRIDNKEDLMSQRMIEVLENEIIENGYIYLHLYTEGYVTQGRNKTSMAGVSEINLTYDDLENLDFENLIKLEKEKIRKKEEYREKMKDVDPYGEEDWEINESAQENYEFLKTKAIMYSDWNEMIKVVMKLHELGQRTYKTLEEYQRSNKLYKFFYFQAGDGYFVRSESSNFLNIYGLEPMSFDDFMKLGKSKYTKIEGDSEVDPYGEEDWGWRIEEQIQDIDPYGEEDWGNYNKLKHIKLFEQYIDHSDIDPYGEEDWEYDNLPPVLQIAIRQNNKPYDQITVLYCHNNQLTSLEGIENLVNLEKLICYDNQLTSLEGIENLVNLERLGCSNNQLTSLKGIEKLVNLKVLWYNSNQLTSLEGIENLVNLERLGCSNNQLTSLKGIEKLVNLKELNCQNNLFSKDYEEYLINYCEKNNIYLNV